MKPTKISKQTRERAALICAASASSDGQNWYWDCADALGVRGDQAALQLACDALCATDLEGPREPGRLWPREDDALAEALLRTGWAP